MDTNPGPSTSKLRSCGRAGLSLLVSSSGKIMVPSFGGCYYGFKKVCSSLFGRGGLLKIGRICESWDAGFLPLPASSARSRAE